MHVSGVQKNNISFEKNNIHILDPALAESLKNGLRSLPKHDLFIARIPSERMGLPRVRVAVLSQKTGKELAAFTKNKIPKEIIFLNEKILEVLSKYKKINLP